MKKIIGLFVCFLLSVSLASCAEKETASEILNRASSKMNEANGIEMKMEVDVTMSLEGMDSDVEMSMEIDTLSENLLNPEELIMSVSTAMSEEDTLYGQSTVYYVDGVLYTDAYGTKTKAEMDAAARENLVNYDVNLSEEDLKNFTVTKSEDGVELKGKITDLSKAMELLSTGQMLDDSLLETMNETMDALEMMDFEVIYEISNEDVLEEMSGIMQMRMQMEDMTVEMQIEIEGSYDYYEGSRIELPDLSEWEKQTAACVLEMDGVSEMMVIDAESDVIVQTTSYLMIDYELYGITSGSQKEEFNRQMEAAYASLEGVSVSVESFGDQMVMTLTVDYQSAPLESLVAVGMASSDASSTVFSLSDSLTALTASGYTCE